MNEEFLLSKNASSFLDSKLFTTTRVVELTARKLLEARLEKQEAFLVKQPWFVKELAGAARKAGLRF